MGQSSSRTPQDSNSDDDAVYSPDPPSDHPEYLSPPEDEETVDAKITRSIVWQFHIDKKEYSPSVEAFGLKWYFQFI